MAVDHTLLIIWHSRTGTAEALARAALKGAGGKAQLMRARDVEPEHLLQAGAYLFICPENLASMTGEMKEMFDRCYYPVLDRIAGRAYATAIAAGTDGSGALRQIDRIVTGWRLKRVAEPLTVITGADRPEAILALKTPSEAQSLACEELGAALATGLELGMF